ncbi:hypothetical protein BKA70DRAFT_1262823 [Coprinopsis sp. MPI-PUGE-AT-0042]|nr:hypothetical protein BKA70DRAFT_1262823 [Coprinopsis sp. MPI-PUGE-AT-0042]
MWILRRDSDFRAKRGVLIWHSLVLIHGSISLDIQRRSSLCDLHLPFPIFTLYPPTGARMAFTYLGQLWNRGKRRRIRLDQRPDKIFECSK